MWSFDTDAADIKKTLLEPSILSIDSVRPSPRSPPCGAQLTATFWLHPVSCARSRPCPASGMSCAVKSGCCHWLLQKTWLLWTSPGSLTPCRISALLLAQNRGSAVHLFRHSWEQALGKILFGKKQAYRTGDAVFLLDFGRSPLLVRALLGRIW